MKKFRITTDAHLNIIKKIGSKAPEQGGILVGKNGIITDFVHDEFAKTSGSTYSLNVEFLNPIIKKFKNEGKELLGIIHSHPFGASKLSNPDKEYFLGIFKNAKDLDFLFTPIVFSGRETEFHMFPYVFYKDGTIEELELEILPNDYEEYIQKPQKTTSESVSETHFEAKPEPKVIEQRKQLLVMIHRHTTEPSPKEKDLLPIPKIAVAMAVSGVYFFVLGLCAGTFPIAYFFIIKNLLKL